MVHVPYFCIFAIRENEILISMTYDSLFFFLLVNCVRDPTPLPSMTLYLYIWHSDKCA